MSLSLVPCSIREASRFTVNPGRGIPNVGRARVVTCEKVWLYTIDEDDARREGFETRQEFIDTWRDMHGSWTANEEVWRIEFEVIA